uniref:Ataxin 2 SM domain-containing protein n=1 Tax=Ditylenchus dipsaci TaxID=166011 RepID=A0A915EE34_9BILA
MNKTGSVEIPNAADKQKKLDGPVALSSCVISMIGREIEVKTVDGETWAGTLKACSSNFDIGLVLARKCPISEDHKGCIVNAVSKMEFKSQDVVDITVLSKKRKQANSTLRVKKASQLMDKLRMSTIPQQKTRSRK